MTVPIHNKTWHFSWYGVIRHTFLLSLVNEPPVRGKLVWNQILASGVTLRKVPPDTKVFLCSLWLCRKSRSQRGMLESKKKIGDNQTFCRDNEATIILEGFFFKNTEPCMEFSFEMEAQLSLKNAISFWKICFS